MKALLALGGVLVFGAGVYFIARGKQTAPNVSSKQANGSVGKPGSAANIASQLLTSQNLSQVGGLLGKLGGGSASVATPGGSGGSGFVTSYD